MGSGSDSNQTDDCRSLRDARNNVTLQVDDSVLLLCSKVLCVSRGWGDGKCSFVGERGRPETPLFSMPASWFLSPALHHHFTTTAPALHHHFTATSPPLHRHFTTTSPPLHNHLCRNALTQRNATHTRQWRLRGRISRWVTAQTYRVSQTTTSRGEQWARVESSTGDQSRPTTDHPVANLH